MRFKKYLLRQEKRTVTERMKKAFERKQAREAESLPLFGDQIREIQHSWEEEKRLRDLHDGKVTDRMRQNHAAVWRKARAAYFALDADTRAKCRAAWNAWVGPSDPLYLIYVVNQFNGVGAAREANMAADRQAMNSRIMARLRAQPELL